MTEQEQELERLLRTSRGYEQVMRNAYVSVHGSDGKTDLRAEAVAKHITNGCEDCRRAYQVRRQEQLLGDKIRHRWR